MMTEACGEIESHHPGYLGSQDTFYVGTIKGGGRIYQQTFVDTYSKWAAAKFYTTNAHHRSRPPERPGFAFLFIIRNGHYPHTDGQGHGILWQAGNA